MFDLTALGWCRPGLRMDSTLCPVYMGTCAASLTAPSHIPVIQALPHEDHFLLPVRYQPLCVHMCVCVYMREGGREGVPSLLLHPGRLLPPPCLFPSPQGATREWLWPRLKHPSPPPCSNRGRSIFHMRSNKAVSLPEQLEIFMF